MQTLKKLAVVTPAKPAAPSMPALPTPPKIQTPPTSPTAPRIPTSAAPTMPASPETPAAGVNGQRYTMPPLAAPPKKSPLDIMRQQRSHATGVPVATPPQRLQRPTTPEYSAFSAALQQPSQRVGDVHGAMLDPGSPETLQFWQRMQQERAAAMAQNPQQAAQDARRYDPGVLARRYIRDVANKREMASEAENMGTLYQRVLGFNRLDPRTGKYTVTADENLGKNPEGLYGAIKGTLGGIPTAAASTLTLPVQAIKGDYSPIAGSMRDLMALPNHLRGTDIGHNIKTDAAIRTPYDIPGPVGDIVSGKDVPTTPGLFSSVHEPLTQQAKPSQLDAAAGHMDAAASDKGNGLSPVHKILARSGAGVARNADDAYLAAMTARGLGLNGTTGMMVGGGLSRAVPTALDPGSGANPTDRANSVLQNAYQGAMTPFSVNPLYAGTQEAMNQYGVQDAANSAGNYIRENLASPDAGRVQRMLANTAAGAVEHAPGMLPAAFGSKSVGQGLKNVGQFAGLAGLVDGGEAALSPTDASSTAAQQFAANNEFNKKPVVDQNDARLGEQLKAIQQYRESQGLPATPELDAMVESKMQPADAAQQDSFDFASVLPNGKAITEFAASNPERAQEMLSATGKSLEETAKSPAGQAVLTSVKETGQLPPEADKVAKYNLMQDGFDTDKIGEWYNQLGGAEKFALWGGVSMTMLGLAQAINGGGVGSWLTALLGLGAVGLTAGQSGVFGGDAQQASEAVTKPIGNVVDSGIGGIKDTIGNVLKRPGVIKALSPMMGSLPDNAVVAIQKQLRQHSPETAAQLDSATNKAGWKGLFNDISGYGNSQAMQKLTQEYGFPEDQAARWLELWPQSV